MKKTIQHISQQAFSLIEMVVCISIISILCAISLPNLMNLYQGFMDEMLLTQLLRTLTFAHHEALMKSMPVAVCKSKNRESCAGEWQDGQLVFIDKYGDGSIRSKEQVLAIRHRIKQHGFLHFRAFPSYRDYLLFTSRGWMANDNGTFWYCPRVNVSPVWAVMLTKSGSMRVLYPDKNGDIKDSHGQPISCASS